MQFVLSEILTVCVGSTPMLENSLPKAIYNSTTPIKISVVYFTEPEKNSNIYIEPQKILKSHSKLVKEEQRGRNHGT